MVRFARMILDIANFLVDRPLYLRRKPGKYFQDGMYIENIDKFRNDTGFLATKTELIRRLGVDYEMDWRTHVAIQCAKFAKSVAGDFVELGCGEGWVANAILISEPDILRNRKMFLFDKFDGLSVDINSGINVENEIHPRYPRDPDSFKAKLFLTENVYVVPGSLPETLAHSTPKTVAFLHIDLNAASPEVESLRILYPGISKGGIVLLDDYCGRGREVQHDAMNDLATKLGFSIMSLPTGQGLVIKS